MDKDNSLIPFIENGKWGYKNHELKTVINPIYQAVDFFYNGTARVKINDKIILINKNEAILTKSDYASIENPKHDNLNRRMYLDEKYGVLDHYGFEIVPPIYMDYAHFSENRYNFSNPDRIISYDIQGKVIFEIKNLTSLSWFREGYSRFKKNTVHGFLNMEGDTVISPTYQNVSDFKEGVAVFKENNRCGLINKNNEILVKPIFEDIDAFSSGWFSWIFVENGLLEITKNSKKGLINKNGEIVLNYDYHQIDVVDINKVVARNFKEIYLINLEYNTFTKTPFTSYTPCNYSKNLIVEKSKLFGVINFYGETIIDFLYDDLSELNFEYFSFKKNDINGIINKEGKIFMESKTLEFKEINPFFIITQKNSRFGLLALNGVEILKNEHNSILLDNNYAILTLGYPNWITKSGIIDSNCNKYFE